MTKQETDISKLLEQVTSDRKKQLFALACCRSIEHLLQDQRSKDCLEKIELFIDGKCSFEEFELARQDAWNAYVTYDNVLHDRLKGAANAAAWAAAANAAAWAAAANAAAWAADAYAANWAANWATRVAANKQDEEAKQIEFLKDIYNPNLISIAFPQKAIQLAEEVYDTNNQTTRLVLSDFLEEFHFPEELYLHLKQPNHYKGCWVIDQILEKL